MTTTTETKTTGSGRTVNLDYEGHGFASAQLIAYLIEKHPCIRMDAFAVLFLRKVIDYGLENNRVSKDGLAYFLSDLIPELEFNEVCGYYADECLTENGKEAKREFWEHYEDYIRKANQ